MGSMAECNVTKAQYYNIDVVPASINLAYIVVTGDYML